MKLLLVEDDFDLAGALSRSLVARGFEVLCCADGKEALAAARRTALLLGGIAVAVYVGFILMGVLGR